MEEERARKAEIRKAKKVAGASKKKTTNQVPPSDEPLASASTSSASTSTAAPTVAPEGEIDVNVCCTCFVRYEDDLISGSGTDWISCTCGRWLHEDCAEDCVLDKDGKDPFCLDVYS